MSEVFLNRFNVIAVLQRIRCEAVAEIMETLFTVIDLSNQSFVIVVDG